MKKAYSIFPVLALLTTACSNVLEYKSGQEPEVLVMNASLRTDETTHNVFLSISRLDETIPVEDAELRCFINGEFVAEGIFSPEEYAFHASRYNFDADIRPGDEVRLEARYGKLQAKATVTAPKAAPLAAVDTARIECSQYYSFLGYEIPMLGCKLHLQDNPNQTDWYRLLVLYEADTPDRTDGTNDRRSISFEYTRDPILCDGNPPMQSVSTSLFEITAAFIESDVYCTFRDIPFAGDAAEVEIEIHHNQFAPHYSYNADKDVWEEERVENKRLRFDLLSITKEEYDYLRQLSKQSDSDSGFNALFLREPIHIPVNVEGGLGFVSVASVSSRTISL